MNKFAYKAYDKKGRLMSGMITADTRESALERLHDRDVVPLELDHARSDSQPLPWWKQEVFSSGRISQKSLALIFRELSTLIAADIPVDQSLQITSLHTSLSTDVRQRLRKLHDGVVEGQSLSSCLAAQGNAFPDLILASVRAGETSGRLSETLGELAALLEHSVEVRQRITTSLIYPCVLIVMALIAVGVIVFFLAPTVVPLLRDAGAEVPGVISMLHAIQQSVSNNWATTLVATLASIGLFAALFHAPGSRRLLGKIALNLPGVGKLIADNQAALFTRTLSTMTASDVPLLDAVSAAGRVVHNPVFSDAADRIHDYLKEGTSLTDAMTLAGCYPELVLRLVAIGETTGQLDQMLARGAGILETSVKLRLERITVLLTPALTIFIGCVIGWLIISVMNALYSVNTLVGI